MDELTERRSSSRVLAAEVVGLGLAPILAFLVYRVQPMATVNSIDPTLYMSYIQNGPDLIERFGTDGYYWSHAGQVVPGRISYLLFGSVPGFYVLRYLFVLLAIVPAYLLFKRVRGRSAGAVAVAAVLVSPIFFNALGSDYPAGAGTAYLIGGSCCLLMPSAGRARWAWLAVAGVLLSASVHCNLFAGALVLAIVTAYVIAHRDLGVGRLLREAALLAGLFVVTSLGLAVASELFVGAGNLAHPNLLAIENRTLDVYHSTTWRWLLRETQLFIGPLLLVVWTTLWWARRFEPAKAELAAVLALAFELAGAAFWQFFLKGSMLENYFYSSMLWAGVSLVLGFVCLRLTEGLRAHRELAALGVVVAVPFVLYVLDSDLEFHVWPWVPIMLLVGAACGLLAGRADRREAPGAPVVAVAGLVVVVLLGFALAIGKPQNQPHLEGQANQPQANYGDVFFNPDDRFLEFYEIAGDLIDAKPRVSDQPGALATWWPGNATDIVQVGGATELWRNSSINGFDFASPGLPVLSSTDAATINDWNVRYLLMLADDAAPFDEGVRALAAAGFEPSVVWDRAFVEDDVDLAARLVEVGTWRDAAENSEGGLGP